MRMPQRWWLFPGHHVSRIPDHFCKTPDKSFITGLAVAPDETVWAMVHQQLMVYRQQQWHAIASFAEPFAELFAGQGSIHHVRWWRDRLWLGSQGLWVYHDHHLQAVRSLPTDMVVALHIHNQQRCVVGFRQAGIWWTDDGEHWTTMAHPDPAAALYTLTVDSQAQVWVVVQRDTPYAGSRQPVKAQTIYYYDRGWTTGQLAVWCASLQQGAWEQVGIVPKPVQALSMIVDQHQQIWISSQGQGMWRYNQQEWKQVRGPPYVLALIEDASQRVWAVSLHGSEFSVYHKDRWHLAFPLLGHDQTGKPMLWDLGLTTAMDVESTTQRLWFGTGSNDVGWVAMDCAQPLVLGKQMHFAYYDPATAINSGDSVSNS
jgi:hypothetical protein